MQLDLLLRSILYHTDLEQEDIMVYYDAADDYSYMQSYCKLFSTYNRINKYSEYDFKKNILDLLNVCDQRVLFLCDDYVFVRSANISAMAAMLDDPLVHSIQLYMGANIIYGHNGETLKRKIVRCDNSMILWRPSQHVRNTEFGYFNSIAATIHRTSWLMFILRMYKFNCPNVMEGKMNGKLGRLLSRPYTLAPEKCACIHINQNRIQTVSPNPYMDNGITAQELNRLYIDGRRVSISNIYGIKTNTCDVSVGFKIN